MSILSLLNKGLKIVDTTGVKPDLKKGQQRSFFLQPVVYASESLPAQSNGHYKGKNTGTDKDGDKYPLGFTPNEDFYINPPNEINTDTGLPVENGNVLKAGIRNDNGKSIYGIPRDTNVILDKDIPAAFEAFDDPSNEEFLHHLDRGKIPLKRNTDLYLTSFIETDTDNEDPVSFGYDIIIDNDNSPLFNGAVEDFINEFVNYSEIKSRAEVIENFKKQFFKFFKVDIENSLGLDSPRTYYLQKIGGLSNLTETISPDKIKQFIDYGKDYITLSLKEDVSVNTGYLAALYKLLTWSRVHGKKMIPDNLLRFDVEIIVTEARKFNRVIRNDDNTMDQYADLMSRYRYKLYECQLFFDSFSHGNEIDMSNLDYTNNYDIKFNYKFSTMKFEKILNEKTDRNTLIRNHIELDNSKVDINKVDPKTAKKATFDNNTITLNPVDLILNKYTPFGERTTYNPLVIPTNAAINIDPFGPLNNPVDNFKPGGIKQTQIKTVSDRTSLLKKTLENIESTFKSDVKSFIYGLKQDALDFIPGNFVGGFTEDGWEYNIPAYYINKTFNTVNNTLKKSIGAVRANIYEQKNVFVQGFLNNINEGINAGNNLLNNELGKVLNPGGNPKGKPANIYGDGVPSKIIYDGSNVNSDNAPLTPPHHNGTNINIYTDGHNNEIFPDTPPHTYKGKR